MIVGLSTFKWECSKAYLYSGWNYQYFRSDLAPFKKLEFKEGENLIIYNTQTKAYQQVVELNCGGHSELERHFEDTYEQVDESVIGLGQFQGKNTADVLIDGTTREQLSTSV